MSYYLLGSILGAIVVTGVLTRIVRMIIGGTPRNSLEAFVFVVALSVGIGSFTMGTVKALAIYVPTSFFWLMFDLVRAQRKAVERSEDGTEKREASNTDAVDVKDREA